MIWIPFIGAWALLFFLWMALANHCIDSPPTETSNTQEKIALRVREIDLEDAEQRIRELEKVVKPRPKKAKKKSKLPANVVPINAIRPSHGMPRHAARLPH